MTRIIKYTAVIVASALASEAFTGKLRHVIEDAIIRQLQMCMYTTDYDVVLCFIYQTQLT
jgi:hypothetical protein